MLTKYCIANGTISETVEDRANLWIFAAPTEVEKKLLVETLRLDEYDLASSLDPDEVPRLELLDDRVFMLWKAPQGGRLDEASQLTVHSVGLVLDPGRLTVILDQGEVALAAREYRNAATVQDVLLAFLLRGIRHYVGHLRVIKQISTELELKITVSMENQHLLQMFALSESLIYYVDAIESNEIVLTKLRGFAVQLGLTARQMQLLDDIILENRQASRQAQIHSSVLSGLMDARGTVVNNNMGVLLKNLTLINVVFLPLNLIASIGGMSEWSMITSSLGLRWPVAYGLFLIAMMGVGWLTWLFVTRQVNRRGHRTKGRSR